MVVAGARPPCTRRVAHPNPASSAAAFGGALSSRGPRSRAACLAAARPARAACHSPPAPRSGPAAAAARCPACWRSANRSPPTAAAAAGP
eukprot:2393105-Prymnesium_polylepis.1